MHNIMWNLMIGFLRGVCIAVVLLGTCGVDLAKGWTWNLDEVGTDGLPVGRPLIIGHRGSCGKYPEHTVLSHERAAEEGADILECDMVLTKDLEVVCSHESWMAQVSNVNLVGVGPEHADFSERLSTVNFTSDTDPDSYYDDLITDFFIFDFTLAELKTLRRRQPFLDRDPNFNWQYSFLTLREFLVIASKNKLGIYPEFKQLETTNKILASRGVNRTFEALALEILSEFGYEGPNAPCFLQCFELNHLLKLKEKTSLRRIFLMEDLSKLTPRLLDRLQNNGIYGVGLWKNMLVELQSTKHGDPMPGHVKRVNAELVTQIKNHGLVLHVYTFRNEARYINWDDGQDFTQEYDRFLDLGVDGFFTDFPLSLRRHLVSKARSFLKISEDETTPWTFSPRWSLAPSHVLEAVAAGTFITIACIYFLMA